MSKDKMPTVFLSYARGDDEPFVRRLYDDLTAHGFTVWFDRVSMPSRNLTFHQEIRDAIAARERLVLVVGPKAAVSDHVHVRGWAGGGRPWPVIKLVLVSHVLEGYNRR